MGGIPVAWGRHAFGVATDTALRASINEPRSTGTPAHRHVAHTGGVSGYVCLVEVRLHLNDSGSLKQKRKVVHSLKAQVRQRFGASVAEIDGHDTWQRTTLLCALVGGSEVGRRAEELERFIDARCPDGCAFERDLLSLSDLRD